MNNNEIDVSIVIVCMNNLNNLCPCLDSIKEHTIKTSYEVLVVAYLFTQDNLERVRNKYPWVRFIESNEIRGFSENNNLALCQARGKYCFVLNDDTKMEMPAVDTLVESFAKLPENAAIVSPVILFPSGKVQFCGVPPKTWVDIFLKIFHLKRNRNIRKYCNQEGLFRSYNIIGAAFLIKRDVFEKMGWFDEYYFFSPEDLALSTLLNESGYGCYVNSDARIIHYEGMTGKSLSMIQTATKPASIVGALKYYSRDVDSCVGRFLIKLLLSVRTLSQYLMHKMRGSLAEKPNIYQILSIGNIRSVKAIWSNKTPKEIFIKYYSQLKTN